MAEEEVQSQSRANPSHIVSVVGFLQWPLSLSQTSPLPEGFVCMHVSLCLCVCQLVRITLV